MSSLSVFEYKDWASSPLDLFLVMTNKLEKTVCYYRQNTPKLKAANSLLKLMRAILLLGCLVFLAGKLCISRLYTCV